MGTLNSPIRICPGADYGHVYCSAFVEQFGTDGTMNLPKPTAGLRSDTEPAKRERVLILGAAGRDFHIFNVCFRDDPNYKVVGFTAAQIPGIENRRYPEPLSGLLYPDGIPIFRETDLESIIHQYKAQQVVLAYSDLSHISVMHL